MMIFTSRTIFGQETPDVELFPSPLKAAILRGDREAIESLMQPLADTPLSPKNPYEDARLSHANALAVLATCVSWDENQENTEQLKRARMDYMEVALTLGADPNLCWGINIKVSLLLQAVKQDSLCNNPDGELVNYLLQKGANPNDQTISAQPLPLAIQFNQDRSTRSLLEHGAIPTGGAMHAAIKQGSMNAVNLLFKHGFPKDQTFEDGTTVLGNAILAKQDNIVRALLAQDFDPNAGVDPTWWHALQPTTFHLLPLLFEYGAEINKVDHLNQTGLHIWSASFEDKELDEKRKAVFDFLIEKGIDIDIMQKDGHTAEDLANLYGFKNDIALLRTQRANLAAQQIAQSTPQVSKVSKGFRL